MGPLACLLALVLIVGLSAIVGRVEGTASPTTAPTMAPTPFGNYELVDAHIVTSTADGATSSDATDVDNDGHVDIVVGSYGDDTVSLFFNSGDNENFDELVLSTAVDTPANVQLIDLNADDRMDVVWADKDSNKITWAMQQSSGSFSVNDLVTGLSEPCSLFVVDLDRDLHLDLVVGSGVGVLWFENDGSTSFPASGATIVSDSSCSVFAIDVDGDKNIDVVSGRGSAAGAMWHKNDGSATSWTSNTITTTHEDRVFAADMDNDGDVDIVSHEGTLSWNENDGSQNFEQHVLGSNCGGDIDVADMDGNGLLDILCASETGDYLAWWANNGSWQGEQVFVKNVAASDIDGARSPKAVDVDGDGDLDMLINAYLDDNSLWLEMTGPDTGDDDDAKSGLATKIILLIAFGSLTACLIGVGLLARTEHNKSSTGDNENAAEYMSVLQAFVPLMAVVDLLTDWLFCVTDAKTNSPPIFWTCLVHLTLVLCLNVVLTVRIYLSDLRKVHHEENSFVFGLVVLLSLVDVELISLLPWDYKKRSAEDVGMRSPFFSLDHVKASLILLVAETIPELILQGIYVGTVSKSPIALVSVVVSCVDFALRVIAKARRFCEGDVADPHRQHPVPPRPPQHPVPARSPTSELSLSANETTV